MQEHRNTDIITAEERVNTINKKDKKQLNYINKQYDGAVKELAYVDNKYQDFENKIEAQYKELLKRLECQKKMFIKETKERMDVHYKDKVKAQKVFLQNSRYNLKRMIKSIDENQSEFKKIP